MDTEWADEVAVPWRSLARCGHPISSPRRGVREKVTDIIAVKSAAGADATIELRQLAKWLGRDAGLRRQRKAGRRDDELGRRYKLLGVVNFHVLSTLRRPRMRVCGYRSLRFTKVGQWRDKMGAQGRFATQWLQGRLVTGLPALSGLMGASPPRSAKASRDDGSEKSWRDCSLACSLVACLGRRTRRLDGVGAKRLTGACLCPSGCVAVLGPAGHSVTSGRCR